MFPQRKVYASSPDHSPRVRRKIRQTLLRFVVIARTVC